MLKKLILIFLLISSGCAAIGNENMNKEEIIKFTDSHIEKIIKRDFQSAYQDYYLGFRSTVSCEQFKSIFENQLDKAYGQLKAAQFKDMSFGKRITIGKIFNIVTIFYKAGIDKPNTFIKIEVIQGKGGFAVLSYQYINFAINAVPPELK